MINKKIQMIMLFIILNLTISSLVYAFTYQTQTQNITQTIIRKWLSGWDKRVKITIDHNDITSSLSNFPVLIYLSTSSGYNSDDVSFIFNELQSDTNRKKIAVTTSDKTTQCYVEIEKWDTSNMKAWLWVKVPSINSTVDTNLYLYYDKDQVDNTHYVGDTVSTPAQNVWDSDYKGVWHLKEDPTGTAPQMKDSTSNTHHGTTTGMVSGDQTSGKIDGSLNFDATDAYVQTTSGESKTSTSFTWEAWFKADSITGAHLLLWEGPVAENGWGAGAVGHQEAHIHVGAYNVNNVVGAFYGTDELANPVYINVAFTDTSAFHHVAFVLTNAGSSPSGELFLDGVSVGTDTGTQTSRTEWNTNLRIGRCGVSTRYFDGISDEVRVSNTVRSAAWIKASYESERDHLLDFGNEEVA